MVVIFLIAIIAIIIFLGVFGEFIFIRTRVPDVLLLVLVGLLVGPIFGIVNNQVLWAISPYFSALALIVIMFEGGLHLNIYKVVRNTPRGFVLAVTGFILTVVVITAFTEALSHLNYLQNWSIINGLMLGSILGGSSSLIVMPLVRTAKLNEKVTTVLSIESALTDVLCVVVTIALINFLIVPSLGIAGIFQGLSASFAVGAVFGCLFGLLWLITLKHLKPIEGLSKHSFMLTFGFLLILYALTEFVKGSGAISCLAFGIVLGNAKEIGRMLRLHEDLSLDKKVKEFNQLVSFFIKTFFFAFIGMLVVLELFPIVVGLALGLIIFYLRPLAVRIATYKAVEELKENRNVMNALIPRGLAAAVLALLPVSMGIPGTELFNKFVFIAIIVTIIITTIAFFLNAPKPLEEKRNETNNSSCQKNSAKFNKD